MPPGRQGQRLVPWNRLLGALILKERRMALYEQARDQQVLLQASSGIHFVCIGEISGRDR